MLIYHFTFNFDVPLQPRNQFSSNSQFLREKPSGTKLVQLMKMPFLKHCSLLGSKITSLNFEVQFSPASDQQSKSLRTTVNSRGTNREFLLEKGVWDVIITSHSSMLLLVSWLRSNVYCFLPNVFLFWVNFVWKQLRHRSYKTSKRLM